MGLCAAGRWGAGLAITEHRPSSTDRSRLGWRYRALRRDLRRAGARAVVSTPFARALEDYWGVGSWDVIALPVDDAVFAVPRPRTGGARAAGGTPVRSRSATSPTWAPISAPRRPFGPSPASPERTGQQGASPPACS